MQKRINCIFVTIPKNYTFLKIPDFIFGLIFNLNIIMETNINKVTKSLSFISVLFVITFSLLSFSAYSTISLTNKNITIAEKKVKVVITKNTTLEELQKIKKQMESEGLGFDYSNVVYNENNEIISITIAYRDANNNSGKYSVSSEKPINDIVIVSEGTRISVNSTGGSNQALISQGSGKQVSDFSENNYTERKEAMKQRMAQMEKEMEERRAEMKMRMQKRRDSLNALNKSQARNAASFNGPSHLITKNTTDAELHAIQNEFDASDISFKYTNLVRNDNNEITHISITIDNRNGSVSTSTFNNGNEAIKNITVAVDKQHTIMKSAE